MHKILCRFILCISYYIFMKKNILDIIANNVSKRRIALGLSQEKLAEEADVHRNYIGLVERSDVNISVVMLEKIANGLKISISELLKND